jgi:hypothetical protein
MRVDVMSRLRGVDPFRKLWARRTSMLLPDGLRSEVLSLPDLLLARKTQRDKDWPMIRRLVEAHYFSVPGRPTVAQIRFWLRELRTPSLIVDVARRHPGLWGRAIREPPLLADAAPARIQALEEGLAREEAAERERDRRYWLPLRQELEQLRHARQAVIPSGGQEGCQALRRLQPVPARRPRSAPSSPREV